MRQVNRRPREWVLLGHDQLLSAGSTRTNHPLSKISNIESGGSAEYVDSLFSQKSARNLFLGNIYIYIHIIPRGPNLLCFENKFKNVRII